MIYDNLFPLIMIFFFNVYYYFYFALINYIICPLNIISELVNLTIFNHKINEIP